MVGVLVGLGEMARWICLLVSFWLGGSAVDEVETWSCSLAGGPVLCCWGGVALLQGGLGASVALSCGCSVVLIGGHWVCGVSVSSVCLSLGLLWLVVHGVGAWCWGNCGVVV